jgi:kynureninase
MTDRATATKNDIVAALDAADPLGRFRGHFAFGEPELIYLDGNSLGRMPAAVPTHIGNLLNTEWGERLIRGWNEGWMELPRRLGAKIAQIIGAFEDEVIVADSTSVNLYKAALAACLAQPHRTRIITDNLNFPSDLYVLQGLTTVRSDLEVVVVPSPDAIHGPTDEIIDLIDDTTALVSLSHAAFKSGFLYDMSAVSAAARHHGALTLWDLSHSVGAVPVDVNVVGADLAVGCTYKYLNGGPGAPAFIFVSRDVPAMLSNPIPGWMGHRSPFTFDRNYTPSTDITRFQTGTPPVIAMSAMEPGVDLVLEAGVDALRAKSIQQTDMLVRLWAELLEPRGFTLNSPRQAERRGSHVSLGHEEGLRIDMALIREMQVLPDFRAPDNIRLGIAPIYTRFDDILEAVHRIARVVDERLFEGYSTNPPAVT